MEDVAVTAGLAGSGLSLGAALAWGREGGECDPAPGEGTEGCSQPFSFPPRLPPHPTNQEFGPESCRRCGTGWRPAWARGPARRPPWLCAASGQGVHWRWVRPAGAASADHSQTRTEPWGRLEAAGSCDSAPAETWRKKRPRSGDAGPHRRGPSSAWSQPLSAEPPAGSNSRPRWECLPTA